MLFYPQEKLALFIDGANLHTACQQNCMQQPVSLDQGPV
jgi:hypothetical protein